MTTAQQGAAPDRLQLRSLRSFLAAVSALPAAGELGRSVAAPGLAACAKRRILSDMKKKICVLLFVLATSIPCLAVLIGNFDGLDPLINRADAIAVIRIDEHIDNRSTPNLSTTHKCYVYQTLKGSIPVGSGLPVRLTDTTTSFREKFRVYSTHLVFFYKHPKDKEGIEYDSVQWEGANIEVSPFGNEKVPEGKSVKERIKILINNYIIFRDQEAKREDALLQKVLKS
jgi:hypothetical protein